MMTGMKVTQTMTFRLWLVLLLLIPAGTVAERLYHWTDKNGQTHITQEPPPRQGQLQEIMDYSHQSDQKAPEEGVQPANVRDPNREEKILLEIERRRLEGTESAYREARQERPAEPSGANSCFVELPGQDMYVRVFDIAESGSRGQKIWSGQMKKFEKRKFNSHRGKVSIDFKVGPKESYHSIEVRICTNGGVIQLLPR